MRWRLALRCLAAAAPLPSRRPPGFSPSQLLSRFAPGVQSPSAATPSEQVLTPRCSWRLEAARDGRAVAAVWVAEGRVAVRCLLSRCVLFARAASEGAGTSGTAGLGTASARAVSPVGCGEELAGGAGAVESRGA